MRIAVCDDDECEIDHLSELITEYQLSRGVSVECHFFHNSIDFLCDMKGGEYDLVVLDVVMPGESGIKVARELREKDKNVKLIFISLSPEFAVESYSVDAYHYLLKPIDMDALFPLLDKVKKELSIQEEQGFVLKSREGVVRLSFAEIEFVEVINKKVSIHLTDGVVREVTAALVDLEGEFLTRQEFIKTHRSYIVNLNGVQSIGPKCAVTKRGHSIPVSRQRHNQFQNAYMDFLSRTGTSVSVSDGQPMLSAEKQERNDGMWRILLVDDDPGAQTFWANILRCHGCMVKLAGNGEDALKLAAHETYDCILLDVMIPGEDGFSICERLRKLTHAPVIFLSSITEPNRQVEGFSVGGIDYITKDTPIDLFWAKVETRIKLAAKDRTQFRYGPLLLDLMGHKVLINGKELLLTPVEFDILCLLSEHLEHVFTPEEIFGMVWGGQPWDGGKMVQTHMSRLRRKLEKAWGEHYFIETVWGQGYRFVSPGN
ncbi:MAG: response regulator [Lachnospiraceae bacterium]|nr:response regulator [Lachnospiraceae bacterium]